MHPAGADPSFSVLAFELQHVFGKRTVAICSRAWLEEDMLIPESYRKSKQSAMEERGQTG